MIVEAFGTKALQRFAAVLVCDDAKGNEFLAQMENPKHDGWHEDNARNLSKEDKDRARTARLALRKFVTDTLREIRDKNSPPEQDIPLLGRYLPLDPGDDSSAVIGAAETPTKEISPTSETGERKTVTASGSVKGKARRTKSMLAGAQISTGAGDETIGSAGAGETGAGGGGGGTGGGWR